MSIKINQHCSLNQLKGFVINFWKINVYDRRMGKSGGYTGVDVVTKSTKMLETGMNKSINNIVMASLLFYRRFLLT